MSSDAPSSATPFLAKRIERAYATVIDLFFFSLLTCVTFISLIIPDLQINLLTQYISTTTFLLLHFAYYVPCVLLRSATPGMVFLGLYYRDQSSYQQPSPRKLLAQLYSRVVLTILLPVVFLIDYTLVYAPKKKQTLANRLAGLVVINRPKDTQHVRASC